MADIAQTVTNLVDNAALNLCLGEYSLDGFTEPGQAIDTGDEDVFNAPIL